MSHEVWLSVSLGLLACSGPTTGPRWNARSPAVPQSAQVAPSHEHQHHHDSSAPAAVVKDDDVSADFEVSTIAAHRAMAQEMGIQWTPEPDKDSHLSVTLVNARGETLTGLSVELAVTDPAGNVTRHVANVMSAPGMHHYGIDFQRTIPGAHRVAAVFDFDGHRHTLATTIDVP